MPGGIPEGADYFTVPLKHGAEYVILVAGRWVIVVESGASRSLCRRRGMFKQYKLLDGFFVYTALGEAIPVVGTGMVPTVYMYPHLRRTSCLYPIWTLQ